MLSAHELVRSVGRVRTLPTAVSFPFRLVPRAFAIAVAIVAWVVWYGGGSPVDAIAYWSAEPLDPYAPSPVTPYVYSPAFIQAIGPLLGMPFEAFVAVIRAVELAALYALVGPLLPLVLLLSPVASDINSGNVNIALTAAAWYGLRLPALWAFPLLTKVAPGVGVLWHAFRGEWRAFWIAIGVTAAIVAASIAIEPRLWLEWPEFLVGFDPTAPVALLGRLLIAVLLLAWGARTGRPWVIPIVMLLTLPRLYMMSLCVLVPLANRAAWRRIEPSHRDLDIA